MNTAFQLLPKIELHSHLDCTLSFTAVSQLLPGISQEKYRQLFVAPPRCTSLADYLRHTRNAVDLLQSKLALQVAVTDLFAQLAREHVLYTEIRFAPFLHTQNGLAPEEIVAAVAEACDQATINTGVESRIILCTLRHYSSQTSLATVRLVEAFKGTRVVAFDIAGDEAGYPLQTHVPAFEFARQHDIFRTAHAGEACGPDSLWQTLETLQPARIGHGIQCIQDADLLQFLQTRQIHLEICPRCNLQTGVVADIASHPVNRLYQAGLSLGINTDTRGITATTLADEYTLLAGTFGWGQEHFLACNRFALQAAFCPVELKQSLNQLLDQLAARAASEAGAAGG